MSNGAWTAVIMAGALLVPLALFGLARAAVRLSAHPRWRAVVAWQQANHARAAQRYGPLYMYRTMSFLHASMGVIYLIKSEGSALFPGFAFLGLGAAHWLAFRKGQRDPAWAVEHSQRWLAGQDDLFPEDGDIPSPDVPAYQAPAPLATGTVWHRSDRPLSASELRRRARGQKLEPPV
ncbi:MAG: hypothetical protein GKS06_05215 [Acidobacteria bacterium]|nr:hypothetical protein [Acidobacteriota bacterium]